MAMQVVVTSAFGTSNHVQSLLSHLSSNSDAQFDLQHEILNMSGCNALSSCHMIGRLDWQIALTSSCTKYLTFCLLSALLDRQLYFAYTKFLQSSLCIMGLIVN